MRRSLNQSEFDYPLLILITALVGFGLVMVFSASYDTGIYYFDNSTYFFMRQLIWVGVGIVGLITMASIDFRLWQRYAVPILLVTIAALLAVLIFAPERFGAQRQLLNGSIQPTEIAKIAIIIYIAAWLASKGDRLGETNYGLIPFATILALCVGLILFQPDFDNSILIAITALVMFFVAGAELRQIGILFLIGGIVLAVLISQQDYAMNRLRDFSASVGNPWISPDDHVRKSIFALASGGLFGRGIADGEAKMPGGVPAPHSDSIFAIVGEELGIVGTLLIVAMFLFLAYRGTRIALRAPTTFGTLLAFGLTIWLVFQAFINMAVLTATFPVGGLVLPFISYGGSAMVANLAAVGILLNISRGGGSFIGLRSQESSSEPDANPRFGGRYRRARVSDTGSGRSPAKRKSGAFARSAPRISQRQR